MAQQDINIGDFPNDPNADPINVAFDKVNQMMQEIFPNLDAVASGIAPYETKADMDAVTPTTGDPMIAIVMNDSAAANNGYYRWDDGSSSWIKRDDFYATVLDPEDTSEAVTGKAVGDFLQPQTGVSFDGSFDLSNPFGIVYQDYDPASSVDLSISDSSRGGVARVRIVADQIINFPSHWNFSGDTLVSNDDTLMNLLWIFFATEYDIQLVNRVVPRSSSLIYSQTFDNNTIDEEEWILESSSGGDVIVANERLEATGTVLDANIGSFRKAGRRQFQNIVVSVLMDWTAAGTDNCNHQVRLRGDNGYYIQVSTSQVSEETIKFVAFEDSTKTQEIETGIPKGTRVKIIYNTNSGEAELHSWNGSSWVLEASFTIGIGNDLDVEYTGNTLTGGSTIDGRETCFIDDIYVSVEDYNTELPQ